MSSRSLGELLLRPSSIARIPLYQTHTIRRIAPAWSAQRSISSTPPQPAAQPKSNDDPFSFASRSEEPRKGPVRFTAPRPSQDETSTRIDSLFGDKSTQRRPTTYAPTQSSSSDEVRAARSNHVFGAGFGISAGGGRRGRQAPKLNFDDMALPTDMLDPNLSNKPSESANLATQQAEAFANYPRLNPTYGRTVELDASRGRDLVRGIGMLGSLMARNKIRHEMNKQRFHERGGLKRKRLASERWRARFKTGFREVTKRVSELTGKGW
jgi:small subunit ribosomal protein MRP21